MLYFLQSHREIKPIDTLWNIFFYFTNIIFLWILQTSYEDQDDIYLYGQMEVNKSDNWIIPHSAVVLDSLLTNGKFADIYKIRYQDQKSPSGFVAKVLRSK